MVPNKISEVSAENVTIVTSDCDFADHEAEKQRTMREERSGKADPVDAQMW